VARSINRLNALACKRVKEPGRHWDGGGLFLMVGNAQARIDSPPKHWMFRYRAGAKVRDIGLGSLAGVSLVRARELAAECRALLAEGIDPIEKRREEAARAKPGAFWEVAEQLHASKMSGWRNVRHQSEWLRSLERYCKPIMNKPVDSITVHDVLAILQPIWATRAATASRVRGRIEQVLDAAKVRNLIPEDRANPARWKGHLQLILGKRLKLQRGHLAALPYADVAAFVAELCARESMAALCLEFTILTAARSGESMGARWSEFDLDAGLWVLPRERMKRNREHRVPLSDRCVEILRKLEPLAAGPESFVFQGKKTGRPLSVMALEMVLRRMKLKVTVHGFRSTFRDWAGDCTPFSREIVEEALSHEVGNAVERSYRRGDALDKRRQLMQAWADYCAHMGSCVDPLQEASALGARTS
jgi:integrase